MILTFLMNEIKRLKLIKKCRLTFNDSIIFAHYLVILLPIKILMYDLNLNEQEKTDSITFMLTFTDESLMNDDRFSNSFILRL